MKTKMQEVRDNLMAGEIKAALRTAKDFRLGVSDEQRRIMRTAYECIVHPDFYTQIGKNLDECVSAGIVVIKCISK